MHGLINRSIQCFVTDTYGSGTWSTIATRAELGFEEFESLLTYDTETTASVLTAAEEVLETGRDMFLEDLGTYLVSHDRMAAVRRLLRFGGETFLEFLFSLDDLKDRVRLAVPELFFPQLELRDHYGGTFTVSVTHPQPGFGLVLVGILRAMADDYGALAFLEHRGRTNNVETISVELIEMDYAQGRSFALSGSV